MSDLDKFDARLPGSFAEFLKQLAVDQARAAAAAAHDCLADTRGCPVCGICLLCEPHGHDER